MSSSFSIIEVIYTNTLITHSAIKLCSFHPRYV